MKLLSKLNLFIVWRRMKTYINNILEGLDITGAEAKDLLWTNPDPTVAFNAQSVVLDLSEYDAVAVEYSMITTSNYHKTVEVPLKHGTTIPIMGEFVFGTGGKIAAFYRTGQVSDTGFSFSNGYQSTPSTDAQDQKCGVPCKIYGIRKIKGVVKEAEWTPADWVVERGIRGGWKYEKYNSGKLELWNMARQYVSGTASGSSTLGYDAYVAITLPDIVKTIENVSGTVHQGSAWGVLSGWGYAESTRALTLYTSGNTSTPTDIRYQLKLTGTWK